MARYNRKAGTPFGAMLGSLIMFGIGAVISQLGKIAEGRWIGYALAGGAILLFTRTVWKSKDLHWRQWF